MQRIRQSASDAVCRTSMRRLVQPSRLLMGISLLLKFNEASVPILIIKRGKRSRRLAIPRGPDRVPYLNYCIFSPADVRYGGPVTIRAYSIHCIARNQTPGLLFVASLTRIQRSWVSVGGRLSSYSPRHSDPHDRPYRTKPTRFRPDDPTFGLSFQGWSM